MLNIAPTTQCLIDRLGLPPPEKLSRQFLVWVLGEALPHSATLLGGEPLAAWTSLEGNLVYQSQCISSKMTAFGGNNDMSSTISLSQGQLLQFFNSSMHFMQSTTKSYECM